MKYIVLIILTTTIFLTGAVASADAEGLNADEQRMIEWIDANVDGAIDLLEETVNISSGTMNHKGVREVGMVMGRELEVLGFATDWIEMPAEMQRAGHMFGRRGTRSRAEDSDDRSPGYRIRSRRRLPILPARRRHSVWAGRR